MVGGLFQEMLEKMDNEGYTEKVSLVQTFHQRFDPMMIRCTLDEMILEAGVNVLFHALVNKVDVKSNSNHKKIIETAYIQTKAGTISAKAKVFIDTSGDADLIFHSGADFNLGREEDGLTQPSTLNFRMGNVSRLKAGRHTITKKILAEKAKGNKLTNRDDCLMFVGVKKNEYHFNQTRVAGYDFTDPYELTDAEFEGRAQAKRFIQFLQNDIKGFKKSTVMNLATTLGIRETRRIVGDYELTEEDLKEGTKFEDTIALGNYPIDIHDPKGTGKTVLVHFSSDHFYCIPYRSCIPKDLVNVIVAGRPISSTHVAHSAIRVMPICSAIGHAAGVAAALCLPNENGDVRNVPIESLQKTLKEQNACID